MTPQERQLVAELFERLASLEGAPRDPDADRTIRDGLRQAPNAVYALVQTCLVQDEALKQANARIEELEAYFNQQPGAPQGERGFLDGMRDVLFGQREGARGGSVPSVPPASPWGDAAGRGGAPMGVPPGYRPDGGGGPYQGAQMGGQMPQEPSRGGSFLGTAAATVAGVVGGALLMNGIRSMLGGGGGQQHGPFAGAFDQIARGGDGERNPWSGGDGGSGNLGRDAGLDDIGRGGRSGSGDAEGGRIAGLFGAGDQTGEDDASEDDDGYEDDGDDTSEA